MKRLLAPILLLTLLFPALAQGQSLNNWFGKGGRILCETTGVGCESVDAKDLVETDGLYYKKYTEVPFTGKVTGKTQGSFKDGKKGGPWISYWTNGKLRHKGTYKDGEKHGPWVSYNKNGKKDDPWVIYWENGQLSSKGNFKDEKTAVKWFTIAAELGDALAQYNLGLIYEGGQGVPQDDEAAVKWYKLAAEQGDSGAQYNLGAMYAFGKGVIQDKVHAHMWWNIAASSGNKIAVKNRDKVAKRMTPSQLAKAKDLARECVRKKYKRCVIKDATKKSPTTCGAYENPCG
jgi:antitoxin component YwqK of YwqJK toxin-antitoxin module